MTALDINCVPPINILSVVKWRRYSRGASTANISVFKGICTAYARGSQHFDDFVPI